MTDPDTPTSVPGDAPSGQALGPDSPSASPSAPAPDPRAVKQQGTGSDAAKDLDQWVTGAEPMTGPQASYLETLAQQAGVEVPTGLTKAQASQAIDDLRARASR